MGELLAKILGGAATIAIAIKVLVMIGSNTVSMTDNLANAQGTAVEQAQAAGN